MAGYVTSGGYQSGGYRGQQPNRDQPTGPTNEPSIEDFQDEQKRRDQQKAELQRYKDLKAEAPPVWKDSTEALRYQMQQNAYEMQNMPVERFSPRKLSSGNVNFQQANAAQVDTPESRARYLSAVQRATDAAKQTSFIDPAMQAYLQQSMQLNQGVLAGTAPSLATSQLRAGVDEGIRAQMAMAASGGMNPAAMRGAQQQGAISLQQAANQASAIRAQEIAQARAAQQNAYQNAAQMTLAGSQFETDARQNAMNQYLGAVQGLNQFDQERAMQNAAFAQQAALQNQQLGLQTQQFNVQQQFDVAKLNEMMRAQEFEQYMTNQYNRKALASNIYGTVLTGQNTASQLQQQQQIANKQAEVQRQGAAIGAGATVGGALIAAMSDKNQKKNIKQNDETVAFLNALSDNSYEYKDTSLPGTKEGRQYGPMAQDLEKTSMGKTAVIESPNGKMVDTSRAMLLALSGLSNINARLNKLEGNKRA